MQDIAANLIQVGRRIAGAERRFGRPAGSVRLLAVGKFQPLERLRQAYAAGQRDFGESYLQEAIPKIAAFPAGDVVWHFVGPMQANKTRGVACHFDWAHSVDRPKLAHRLSEQRPAERGPLNVCVQVNISGEASKSGVVPDEALALARAVHALPGLRLRGLMGVPEAAGSLADQRAGLRPLRALFESALAEGLPLDTLSMGMSADLEAAIAEGSTLVRIGTAIFGPREPA